jgi:uncharacterized phage protein (TIGR01671 family)
MREILFRGKRKDNGEWVEGLLWKKKYNTDKLFISCFPDKDDNEDVFVIRPKTVGQYTGLTDKNNVKMFEGDIVTGLFLHSMPVNGVVAFRDGSFGLLWDRAGAETFTPFTSMCNVEYEVIGNIHDNPELLLEGE